MCFFFLFFFYSDLRLLGLLRVLRLRRAGFRQPHTGEKAQLAEKGPDGGDDGHGVHEIPAQGVEEARGAGALDEGGGVEDVADGGGEQGVAPGAHVAAVGGGAQRHEVVEGEHQPGAGHLREERGERRRVRHRGHGRGEKRGGEEEGLDGAARGEEGLQRREEEAVRAWDGGSRDRQRRRHGGWVGGWFMAVRGSGRRWVVLDGGYLLGWF